MEDESNLMQPGKLTNLAVATVCRNLSKTICREEGDQLKLRQGVSLPHSVGSKLIEFLINSIDLEPMQSQGKSDELVKYMNIFTDEKRCKLHGVVLKRAPISDDVVEVLTDLSVAHSLTEIDLSTSSDMHGDSRDETAAYNHAIFLPGFLITSSGSTLQKLTLANTFLAHSLQQISTLSGKKAKALKQDQYLPSDAKIENIPYVISKENAPKLVSLDISGSFIGWFTAIDPKNPPALQLLNAGGHHDKRLNSAIKTMLQYIAYGEPDYKMPDRQVATIARSKSERKMRKYKFFKRFGDNQLVVNKYIDAVDLRQYLEEDDKLEGNYRMQPKGNFILRHLHLLTMKETMQQLSLFGTWLSESDFKDIIFNLKNLTHLDVAWDDRQENSSNPSDSRPSTITIWNILESLPLLKYLDVSGTWYAEALYRNADHGALKMEIERPPLEFLGLWGTNASKLRNLDKLALKVSGDSNSEQLFTCLEKYMHSAKIISDAISKISEMMQESGIDRPYYALELIVRCVKRFRMSSYLLFECTGCIYFLLEAYKDELNVLQKRQLIEAVTIMVENNMQYQHNNHVLRNSLILYFSFDMPKDIFFDFDHIVKLALTIFREHMDTPDIGVIAGKLCTALVYSLEFGVKSLVRKHSFVDVMIKIIKARILTKNGDDVLESAWSALWNVADDTPLNCEDFLQKDGMSLVKQCFELFRPRNDVIRNMTGLIGNIAEFDYLRAQIAKEDLVNIYCELATVTGEDMEVGYNACGILSNLLVAESDVLVNCDRKLIRQKIREGILSWTGDITGNISYRSFKPLLAVLRCDTEPEAQLWVLWAVRNLCDSQLKYIELIIEEGGVGLIRGIRDTTTDSDVKSYASYIIEKCDKTDISAV